MKASGEIYTVNSALFAKQATILISQMCGVPI